MRCARIALCTFEDENPTRSSRRRRILAVLLSACPFGLGFLWAALDEDRLTRTTASPSRASAQRQDESEQVLDVSDQYECQTAIIVDPASHRIATYTDATSRKPHSRTASPTPQLTYTARQIRRHLRRNPERGRLGRTRFLPASRDLRFRPRTGELFPPGPPHRRNSIISAHSTDHACGPGKGATRDRHSQPPSVIRSSLRVRASHRRSGKNSLNRR